MPYKKQSNDMRRCGTLFVLLPAIVVINS